MLYGESGAGKSSLVNAGLIPAAEAEGFDFRVDRIRVQPHLQHELVVERIAVTPDSASFLRSSFAGDADGSQIVLSIEAFRAQLDKALSMKVRPLLIFDQFEELITLFEEARGEGRTDAREAQLRIVGMLVELLLHQTMPVKLVFSFREDYLAQVKELLALSPELVNQSLRLTPPPTDALYEIIRDPFEKHPGHFGHELLPELAHRLSAELASRSPSGAINLSEMQIVCLRLWEAPDPEALLERGGVQAVLEDYLEESLNRFPQELHYPAVALLSQLVTASGVRNIVVRDDLIQRVRSEEPDIPEERLEDALEALERKTKLVRRERRGDLDLFEISSEFLVPWIRRQRAERLKAREQARLAQELEERRRHQRARLIQRLGLVISGLFIVAAVLAGLTFVGWRTASNERDQSLSQNYANEAVRLLDSDPVQSVFRAYDAAKLDENEAEEAFRSALVASHRRAVLTGHDSVLTGAAFSPDGTRVVTSSGEGAVRVWNATSGVQVANLPKLPGAVYATFGPDGERLLTTGAGGTLVWNIEAQRAVARLRRAGESNVAAFSPNGKHVITGSSSGAPLLWNARKWRVLREFATGDSVIASAAFSADGKRVVTSSVDGSVQVWDAASAREVAKLPIRPGAVQRAVFSPDGRFILTAENDGRARIWNADTGRIVRPIGRHEGLVYAASFSPDGSLVATASADGTARLWDFSTGALVAFFSGHRQPIVSASFSPDGSRLVTASADGTGRIWDSGVMVSSRLVSHPDGLTAAAFSPVGNALAIVAGDHKAYVWSGRSGWTLHPLGGIGWNAVSFSPDGRLVATVGYGGTTRFWIAATGQKASFLRDAGPLNSVEFDPSGERILTAGAGATIWELGSRSQRTTLIEAVAPSQGVAESPVLNGAFDPDGNRVVTVQGDEVRVWKVDGSPLTSLPPDERRPVDAAIGSDDLLVVAYADGATTIWNFEDVSNPRRVTELVGHGASVNNVVFGGDGKFILTTSDDGTARLWEAKSGRWLATLRNPTGKAFKAAILSDRYAADEKLAVLTASEDGTLRRYRCDACGSIDDLIALGKWKDVLEGDALP